MTFADELEASDDQNFDPMHMVEITDSTGTFWTDDRSDYVYARSRLALALIVKAMQ